MSCRAASATVTMYQPFRLVTSSFVASRLNDTGVNASSVSFSLASAFGASAAAAAVLSVFGSGFGLGVRLRASPPVTSLMKTSPFFAYATHRPSSDQRSWSPFRSPAGMTVFASPVFASTYLSTLSVPPIVS